MARVEFRLLLDGPGSGGNYHRQRNYLRFREMSEELCKERQITESGTSWFHRWDDGWTAEVSARKLRKGERKTLSDGFYGYDWMIEGIVLVGEILTPDKLRERLNEKRSPHANNGAKMPDRS